jgi:hypothetical protein
VSNVVACFHQRCGEGRPSPGGASRPPQSHWLCRVPCVRSRWALVPGDIAIRWKLSDTSVRNFPTDQLQTTPHPKLVSFHLICHTMVVMTFLFPDKQAWVSVDYCYTWYSQSNRPTRHRRCRIPRDSPAVDRRCASPVNLLVCASHSAGTRLATGRLWCSCSASRARFLRLYVFAVSGWEGVQHDALLPSLRFHRTCWKRVLYVSRLNTTLFL